MSYYGIDEVGGFPHFYAYANPIVERQGCYVHRELSALDCQIHAVTRLVRLD